MNFRWVLLFVGLLLGPWAGKVATADDLLIRGATVHTLSGQPAARADVLVRDGKIAAVGTDLQLPQGGQLIDAQGGVLTPGLIAAQSQLGLKEVDAVAATVDYASAAAGLTAAFDPSLAYNSRSTLTAINRSEGITSAVLVPHATGEAGERGVIAGLVSVVDLTEGGDALRRRGVALAADLGEEGGELAGGSRAAAIQLLMLALEESLDFQANRSAWEKGSHRNYRFSPEDMLALHRVSDGEAKLLVRVDRASDIEALLDLTAKYALETVILGGAEAWMLAAQLADAGVAVVLDATSNLPASFDTLNARLDAAAILDAAGVTIAFGGNSAIDNHNARNTTQAAGMAVAHGLPWASGLAAITLNPAQIFGVAKQIGSIEVGRVANLVLWDADPLELTSFPRAVLLHGKEVPLQNRQTLLRDRYMQRSPGLPAAYTTPASNP